MIDSNVIIQGTIPREYNESNISLDFHVVFVMDRPNVIISFVRIKVGFHLIWLKYKKRKRKERKIFYVYKNNYKWIYNNKHGYISA